METKKKGLAVILLLVLLLNGFCLASATSPARIVSGFFSNALSALLKRLWSLKSTTKTVISGRPMMKFESGYEVETVFDGSKLGIEPFSVEFSPSGELLVLDSANSNMYRISLPLSKYSRPKLVAGSAEGYSGHVDGRLREARMNHPKGFTVDDRGNIYVADTMNMAIRKISETGVTTIAGGKWSRGGHVDGPSEDAKFSNDFEVVYIGSSCSLLVIDRGNQAIREIQLHFDDCAYQYGTGFPLGIAVLFAAGFFGYMLALMQRRVGLIVSSNNEPKAPTKASIPPYQKSMRASVRPPLIPSEDDSGKQQQEEEEEQGILTSLVNLLSSTTTSIAGIFGAGFRKKPRRNHHNYQSLYQHNQQQSQNSWPVQESFSIPDDEPPPAEGRTPTPRKTYAFMSKDPEKIHHLRQSRPYFSGWDEQPLQQQHLHQHQPSGPQTYYERSSESTNEIVFGAVQESESGRRAVEIKAVNYGEPMYDQLGMRSRVYYGGYGNGY